MNRASGDSVTLYFGMGTGTVHKVQNSAQTKIGYFVRTLNIDKLVKSLLFVRNLLFTMGRFLFLFTMGSYLFRCSV